MGQAAVKFDDTFDGGADIVPLKAAGPSGGRPALSVVAPAAEAPAGSIGQDLASVLALIGRAAGVLASQKERGDLIEKRASKAEQQLQVANRRLADAEIRLASALDEAKAEKLRSAEVQRRSNEMAERTRAMLAQAGERLRAAEARAGTAEGSVATIRQAAERQLAPHVKA